MPTNSLTGSSHGGGGGMMQLHNKRICALLRELFEMHVDIEHIYTNLYWKEFKEL
jgi:hypothetical protein